jgi:hypothetical protein
MSLSTELLLAEADRLIFRAERHLASCREHAERVEENSLDTSDAAQRAKRAEIQLKRLKLYRHVLRNMNSVSALMPEYILARGLVNMEQRRGVSLLQASVDRHERRA